MGYRDPSRRRHRNCCGHAWNDLPGHAVGRAVERFLAAASQDKGISALEAHHQGTPPGVLDQVQPVAAVVAPEVAAPLREAAVFDVRVLLDARLLSAFALLVVGRLTGNMLVAIAAGAVVLILG